MEKNSYYFEIWKPIFGFEGWYEVSNFGRVKSLSRKCKSIHGERIVPERIMKFDKTADGYYQVHLSKNGERVRFKVHRLVAMAFIPNPLNLPQINHKDCNPANNCVWNLEWCDQTYNNNYGERNKKAGRALTNHPSFSKQVMCVETNITYPSTHEVERIFGYKHTFINACCNGKYKMAYKLHWKYIE